MSQGEITIGLPRNQAVLVDMETHLIIRVIAVANIALCFCAFERPSSHSGAGRAERVSALDRLSLRLCSNYYVACLNPGLCP